MNNKPRENYILTRLNCAFSKVLSNFAFAVDSAQKKLKIENNRNFMNKQMWTLYKESDRGKKCIKMFNPEIENTCDGIKAILNFSEKWKGKISVMDGWI